MNHEYDYDRDNDREDQLSIDDIKQLLQDSLKQEEELMRSYLISAERIHTDGELKLRLMNFAEGNAKRSRQLQEEIKTLS
ncbi:hypothetical protein [Desertibacillus haloalkaliphilus]|uniref:hypothetical protein n=1 Tax=Desertibacillus haloalkaliphilus TaxID=1328930 RepID=UPI001C25E69B|nr:hypothetical protein [Desertibacillus haloalkaliphilus]MBU8907959.1 hypothetical protein [Desertibacillus haloalkaliphilus]